MLIQGGQRHFGILDLPCLALGGPNVFGRGFTPLCASAVARFPLQYPRYGISSIIFDAVVSLFQTRTVIGDNVTIHNHGYVSTEGLRGKALNFGDAGEFFFETEDVVEFLDVTDEQTSDNIIQAVSISSSHFYTLDVPFQVRFQSILRRQSG